ncbi:pyridoxal phosphate-dependent transferase [Bombardia bombarda]|uniref:aromatic-amino-acid transaminase n=1 Tax=Bombardia bombarda TaxID=252184 RepID=A0AA39WM63_9PEZI|nr:pyridoxal phosphate-dependent transferase [Bombardia bombarda]
MRRATVGLLSRKQQPRTVATWHPRLFHSKGNHGSAEALGTVAKLPEAEPVAPLKPRQNVSLADIQERRAKAGRLVAMTAAYSDSDMFKGPSVGKPKARRWDHHISPEAAVREPCVLKQAAKHLKKPGIISLGGGLPCPEYFPIESLTLRVPQSPHFSEAATRASGQDLHIGKYDVASQKSEYDLSIALNYHQATGSAQLLRFVTEHTELVCNPPYADWRSCLTVGSTGSLEQAFRLLCNGARGDSVLTEEYSFSTALETAAPLGIALVGVRMDEQGLLPESMDEILTNWDAGERGGARKPHVLYTVPSGQNPTGATQGEERRREIYRVAQRHDVYIIEDEPYYFLQMQPHSASSGGPVKEGVVQAGAPEPESVDAFLGSLIPSLLSMDTDGRVMRLDSFSKVLSPGTRLGWVTASEQMIERYIRHAEVCNQGPSGLSQVVVHKLLDETWGHEGYLRWLMNLRVEYTKRRDVMMAACERYLPGEIVSWSPPVAGMFAWFKVDPTLHPDARNGRTALDIEEEIFNLCIDKGVLVGRGSWFRVPEEPYPHKVTLAEKSTKEEPNEIFFRATFAAATSENMTEAIRRFSEAVKEVYKL